ncbi:hypothetical protein ACFL0E_00855 [Nanoarchaeota archaeon]
MAPKKLKLDNVVLDANYKGELSKARYNLDNAVKHELLTKTGLNLSDVSLVDSEYTTILQTEGRVDTYTGKSTESIDEAVRDALQDRQIDYDRENVSVSVKKTAEAPYFLVPIKLRSLNPEKLDQYLEDAINQLRDAYGKRLNPNPDSREFKVLNTKKLYNHDGILPQGDPNWIDRALSVVSEGTSRYSLTAALKSAEPKNNRARKKVKSTVYEQTAKMIIYGQPEKSLKTHRGVIAPTVVTSNVAMSNSLVVAKASIRSQARGAAPAAKDPVQFTDSQAFM